MKTFWWFREGSIAGMARPGFNGAKWLDLDFPEAVVLGWIGKYSSGLRPLTEFRTHLREYAPQIFSYHGLTDQRGNEIIKPLFEAEGFAQSLRKLTSQMQIIEDFQLDGDSVQFLLSRERLNYEIKFLRRNKIDAVVTLTEDHHHSDLLSENFETHHISINDLGAPTMEQVERLAEILKVTVDQKKPLAVHCLAGIGRTSTMIIAAHMLRGERLDELYESVRKANPVFVPSPSQDAFLKSLKAKLQK
jgi:protein-tyrosine phosphatase